MWILCITINWFKMDILCAQIILTGESDNLPTEHYSKYILGFLIVIIITNKSF